MKKIFVALSMVAFLAACDDSSSAENNEPTTLSSIEEEGSSSSSSVTSAGSVTLSSSSLLLSDEGVLSRSSSSETKTESSSSEKLSETSSCSEDDDEYSSSSVILATPCKTETEDNCEYGELKDNRDGQTYKTVKIGDQWWMAENLNYADSVKTPSLLKRNWCYNNESDSCSKYGRLYTWAAAIDSVALATDADNPQDCGYGKTCKLPEKVQGICPEGWHLPTQSEWYTLFKAVDGQSNAGTVLKSQTGWNDNGNGTDAFGFSALPAGHRYNEDNFIYVGSSDDFWSATKFQTDDAYSMYLGSSLVIAGLSYTHVYFGYSVRCVKD